MPAGRINRVTAHRYRLLISENQSTTPACMQLMQSHPHPGIQFNTRLTGARFSTRSESEFIPCL